MKEFRLFLRTGRRGAALANIFETKFNPYHDPRNGQFTFAPGHPNALSFVITSYGRSAGTSAVSRDREAPSNVVPPSNRSIEAAPVSQTGYSAGSTLRLAQYRPNPRAGTGGNSRAFHDPLTLQQAVPALRTAPGGSIIAVADSFFNFSGPANAAAEALSVAYSRNLIKQIKEIDPNYRFETLREPPNPTRTDQPN